MSDTRSKILDCMYKEVAAEGYDKTSIGKICKQVGITKPSVYYYFSSKEDIFVAMMNEYNTEILGSMGTLPAIGDKKAFMDFVIEIGDEYIDFFSQDADRCKMKVQMEMLYSRMENVKQYIDSFYERWLEWMDSVVECGKKLGAIDAHVDARDYSEMVMIFLDGISVSIHNGWESDVKKFWRTFVQNLLR